MYKTFLLSVFILTVSLSFFGQEKEAIASTVKSQVFEEIILHTDRDIYLPGELIWFSADYLVNDHLYVNGLSKVLYVELYSFEGQSLSRKKFEIENGNTYGNMVIPEGLVNDYYIIRAYTQYQRNQPPESLCNHVILVVNPSLPLSKYDSANQPVDEVFYAGIDKKSGKHILGFYSDLLLSGNAEKVFVSENNNSQQIQVHGIGNGLGYCLTDLPSMNIYSISFMLSNGDSVVRLLEDDIPRLYIDVEVKSGFVDIALTANSGKNVSTNGANKLELYSRDRKKILEKEINFSNNKSHLRLSENVLHPGINYFLIRNKLDEVVQIETYFYFSSKVLPIGVSISKNSYSTREKVEINIAKSSLTDSFSGPLSVSVTKQGMKSKFGTLPSFVIENPELLLHHLIEKPVFTEYQQQQVDLLMAYYSAQLSRGDKTFIIAENKLLDWFPETRGVTIKGIVREINSKKGVENIDVMLSVLGDSPQLQIFKTSEEGKFIFAINHIKDLTNVYLTLKSPREDELEILVESDFSTEYPIFTKPAIAIDTSLKAFIEEAYINMQVSELNPSEEKLTIAPTTGIRFSEPVKSIVLDEYISLPSLQVVLNELVPFVKVRRKEEKYYLEVLDGTTNMIYDDPLILVDNLPIYSVDEMLNIHPSVVERIEVLNNTYLYGDHIIKGVVAIYTTTNNFGNMLLPASFTSLEFQATTTPSAVLLSDYQLEKDKQSRIPDFRNMLYWNPKLIFNGNDTTLTFYSTDHTSNYDVIVTGTDKNGQPVYGSASFNVK